MAIIAMLLMSCGQSKESNNYLQKNEYFKHQGLIIFTSWQSKN